MSESPLHTSIIIKEELEIADETEATDSENEDQNYEHEPTNCSLQESVKMSPRDVKQEENNKDEEEVPPPFEIFSKPKVEFKKEEEEEEEGVLDEEESFKERLQSDDLEKAALKEGLSSLEDAPLLEEEENEEDAPPPLLPGKTLAEKLSSPLAQSALDTISKAFGLSLDEIQDLIIQEATNTSGGASPGGFVAATSSAALPPTQSINPIPTTTLPAKPNPSTTLTTHFQSVSPQLLTAQPLTSAAPQTTNGKEVGNNRKRPREPRTPSPTSATLVSYGAPLQTAPTPTPENPQPQPQPQQPSTDGGRIPHIMVRPPVTKSFTWTQWTATMEECLNRQLVVKCFGDYVRLQPRTVQEHKAFTAKLRSQQAEFYTHQLPEERRLRYVVRGMLRRATAEDVKEALIEYAKNTSSPPVGVEGIDVYQANHRLSTGEIVKTGTFFVTLPIGDTGEWLQEKVGQKILLMYCPVSIEIPRPREGGTHCARCQRWGHTAKYCAMSPRCVKCINQPVHSSERCPVNNEELPPTCCNCGGNHLASFKGCTAYTAFTRGQRCMS